MMDVLRQAKLIVKKSADSETSQIRRQKNDGGPKSYQNGQLKIMGVLRRAKLVIKKYWGPKNAQISWKKIMGVLKQVKLS